MARNILTLSCFQLTVVAMAVAGGWLHLCSQRIRLRESGVGLTWQNMSSLVNPEISPHSTSLEGDDAKGRVVVGVGHGSERWGGWVDQYTFWKGFFDSFWLTKKGCLFLIYSTHYSNLLNLCHLRAYPGTAAHHRYFFGDNAFVPTDSELLNLVYG